jgi:peptidoglycan/xylan/chitin deacetylase (PgdA/CDA1 family)
MRRWVVSPVRRRLERLRHRRSPTRLILCYHRIVEVDADPWKSCVSPGHFAEQLEILRDWGTILELGSLVAGLETGDLPRRAVALTFDDGYADNLHVAKPILARYDAPALVFLATGYLDRHDGFWWDRLEQLILRPGRLPDVLKIEIGGRTWQRQLGTASRLDQATWHRHRSWKAWQRPPTGRHRLFVELWTRLRPLADPERRAALETLAFWAGQPSQNDAAPRPLARAEVRTLIEDKLMQIGAHTVTHPLLPALSEAEQQAELEGSRRDCAALVGQPPAALAYPHGKCTRALASLARKVGFTIACSSAGTPIRAGSDRLRLPRIAIADWDGPTFAQKLEEHFVP